MGSAIQRALERQGYAVTWLRNGSAWKAPFVFATAVWALRESLGKLANEIGACVVRRNGEAKDNACGDAGSRTD